MLGSCQRQIKLNQANTSATANYYISKYFWDGLDLFWAQSNIVFYLIPVQVTNKSALGFKRTHSLLIFCLIGAPNQDWWPVLMDLRNKGERCCGTQPAVPFLWSFRLLPGVSAACSSPSPCRAEADGEGAEGGLSAFTLLSMSLGFSSSHGFTINIKLLTCQ